MVDPRTPILIGAGETTQREFDPEASRGPVDLMAEVTRAAFRDAGLDEGKLRELDTLIAIKPIRGTLRNPPEALAAALGVAPPHLFMSATGGNSPQMMVNWTAERIARGETRFALLAGCEVLNSVAKAAAAGIGLAAWFPESRTAPEIVGMDRPGTTEHELAHGAAAPINIYPLFENALRGHYGRTIDEHRRKLGELCHRFTEVAAKSACAWFPIERPAEEIITPTPSNRFVGFPYTKYMNAIMAVDQAAAVLMTSVEGARALGVDEGRWVYLHGAGDAHDLWFVSGRVNYYSSPAIRTVGEKAFRMAGMSVDEMDYIDLYSCFPCAVEIARDMLGIAEDDPRFLTVTGGLPYFGGAGNNYVMHSIAAMLRKLRDDPGAKGLVTANGYYVTKHSAGIYSTTPKEGGWEREDPARYQPLIDEMAHPELVTEPEGRGRIETYTVTHGRDGAPERGIVIGRLEDGRRFFANTPPDRALLESFEREDPLGLEGRVTPGEKTNLFAPA